MLVNIPNKGLNNTLLLDGDLREGIIVEGLGNNRHPSSCML